MYFVILCGFIVSTILSVTAANERLSGLKANVYDFDGGVKVGPPRYCDNYNRKPNLSDGPCSKKDLDADGVCNKTQLCARPQGDSHCFISWRNDSGVVKIVSSGCWLPNHECSHDANCRAFNNSARNGVYFCCCTGNFCNHVFHLDPATDTTEPVPAPEPYTYNQWMILVYVLVPLLVFSAVVIFVFWIYRQRKMAYDDMDGVSVDTPATATTHCTAMSFSPMTEASQPLLLDVKARGRFGKVWRAQHGDSFVAVKTFDQTEKLSWQNEQDIFVTPLMTTHDNILKFLTASKKGDGIETELWLITEFYERGSLADYLKANKVTFPEALRIMKTMACGMSFLHEDTIRNGDYKPAIAHRDFKSKNVLLDHSLNAVIADFGLAVKFTPGESPGESHGQVGTLRYMAPEVLEGAINFQKDAFLRIDMYAFGLVLWEILSRCSEFADVGEARLPFEEELGTHPSMDSMQEYVVEKKMRPVIKEDWRKTKATSTVCETMEECWDHDAEARLSAGCVELRVAGLQGQRAMIEPIANEIHNSDLIMPPPAVQLGLNTETMNQINLHMTNLNHVSEAQRDKNSKPQVNGHAGQQTTTFNNTSYDLDNEEKTQGQTFARYDDGQDSGTFANEDTLSHDGVMEQLIDNEDSGNVPTITVVTGDVNSPSSLLARDRESDI